MELTLMTFAAFAAPEPIEARAFVAFPPAIVKPAATPGVVVVQPFRGPVFHSGHRCPTCGRTEVVIAGWNADGTHTHRCRYDGTSWRH